MSSARGFTLIELITRGRNVAILAAVAISPYKDYVIRTQVAECASLATSSKAAVTELFNHHGRFAAVNISYGLPSSSSIVDNFVVDVNAANGTIDIIYGKDANDEIQGLHLLFSAVDNTGSMEWRCNASNAFKMVWVPTVCRQ